MNRSIRLNALLGYGLIGLLLLLILVGFFWLPYDPLAIDLDHVLGPPSALHWLGTDEFGRDVASRAMLGARISSAIAAETVVIAIVCGTTLGVLAGFLRGWTERLLMTVSDAILAFPGILLALALIAVMGPGQQSIVVALAIAYVPATMRVVRASVLSIREREYVEASRAVGDGVGYTIIRHVLPNALPPILILATSLYGWVLLSESALSFLGVGVPPPAPTWGNMLSSARPYMQAASWLSIAPGLCIVATLMGINMLGDALRDRLDPRDAR
jgi:peptide/nickel transport system permease protein